MKRLVAILIFAVSIVSFCAAQTQTGDATYNPSKTGQHISHPSLSFNTRVKVTNLSNGLSAEAVVNGRIAPSPDRIADIAGELGDILQMPRTGVTRVRIEELHTAPAEVVAAAAPQTPPVQTPPAQTVAAQSAPAAQAPRQTAPRTQAAPAPVQPVQAVQEVQAAPEAEESRTPPPETVVEARYVPVANCCSAMFCPIVLIVLILLILVIVLLVIVVVILLKPQPWPWYYPIWLRRHFRHAKRR
jgi:hypothetical protein